VIAGTGLSGGGSQGEGKSHPGGRKPKKLTHVIVTLSLNVDAIQPRVVGQCQPGSAISAIKDDGSVDCQTTGVVNTISFGPGLQGGGTSTGIKTNHFFY
jgi:hypothetical protein